MDFHGWLDVIGQRNMHRCVPPPVETTPEGLRELIATPEAALHAGASAVPLAWSEPERRGPGVVRDALTFASPLPSGDPRVDLVRAVRWRRLADRRVPPPGPEPAGSSTALVCLAGAYAASHSRVTMFLPPARLAPFDVVSLEMPHHMTRQRADSLYSGQHFVSADVGRLVRSMHQAEAEVRALTASLRASGYGRVVLLGLSVAGNVVLESLVYATGGAVPEGAVSLLPAADAYASLWLSVLGEAIRPRGRAHGVTDGLARAACRLITPVAMGRPAIGGGRILVVYGRSDMLCPAGPARDLIRSWHTRGVELGTGHTTTGLVFWKVRRLVAAFGRAVASW